MWSILNHKPRISENETVENSGFLFLYSQCDCPLPKFKHFFLESGLTHMFFCKGVFTNFGVILHTKRQTGECTKKYIYPLGVGGGGVGGGGRL